MSEQNVEIVRRLFASFGTQEQERSYDHFADDVVWDASRSELFGIDRAFHGKEGVRAFWREWLAAWTDIDPRDHRFHARGQHVVVTWTQTMRGRGSEVVMTITPGMVWTLRDGLVVRMQLFRDGGDALASVSG